jgi:hypothetical protein
MMVQEFVNIDKDLQTVQDISDVNAKLPTAQKVVV